MTTRTFTAVGLLLITTLSLGILSFGTGWAEPRVIHSGSGFAAGNDLSRPLGIFFDTTTNECYVADTGNHQVIVYDENGMPIFRFFHNVDVDGVRTLGEPKSIAVDTEGNIFLTDATVPYLDVLDRNGRRVESIHPPQEKCGSHTRFESVAIGSDNKAYATLSCPDARFVAVIDVDFQIEELIELQSGKPEPSCVTSIAVDQHGKIYVTDPCAEIMVQIYEKDGSYVTGFGRHDSGFDNFSHPISIAVMESGAIWVVDSIRQVVSCFTVDGEFVSYIGGKGDHLGAFNYPSAVATDGKDRLFVLERAGKRFQCFRIVDDDIETAEK